MMLSFRTNGSRRWLRNEPASRPNKGKPPSKYGFEEDSPSQTEERLRLLRQFAWVNLDFSFEVFVKITTCPAKETANLAQEALRAQQRVEELQHELSIASEVDSLSLSEYYEEKGTVYCTSFTDAEAKQPRRTDEMWEKFDRPVPALRHSGAPSPQTAE